MKISSRISDLWAPSYGKWEPYTKEDFRRPYLDKNSMRKVLTRRILTSAVFSLGFLGYQAREWAKDKISENILNNDDCSVAMLDGAHVGPSFIPLNFKTSVLDKDVVQAQDSGPIPLSSIPVTSPYVDIVKVSIVVSNSFDIFEPHKEFELASKIVPSKPLTASFARMTACTVTVR